MRNWLLVILFPLSLGAEVLTSTSDGFLIKIEREVAVTPQQVYAQFVSVSDWWISGHTYFGESKNLSIDAQAGGCFCEIKGDKQVLHMTISYVDPGKEIRMIGGLGPLQMMGAHGGMSWKFESVGEHKTKIIHQYRVVGSSDQALDKLAPFVNKVQSQQVDALVKKLSPND